MRCKYTFKVQGRIRPAQSAPFRVDDYYFEFGFTNGFISQILISFPVSDNEIPRITQDPKPGVSMHIAIQSPRLLEVEEIVRSIEGLWSFWGLENIDVHYPKHEWIAETEEEKKKLKLHSFSREIKDIEDDKIRPISFDLLARPIISAVRTKQHDVALSFYRRGRNDIEKEEYIEAIYDFYFVLESEFANGKNKNYAVEKEFLKSTELRGYLKKCRDDVEFIAMLRSEDRPRYSSLLDSKSIDDLVRFIVNMRGFLHHHSKKRGDIWNPEKQDRFRIEAIFLQNLCHLIAFDVFHRRTYEKDVVSEYERLVQEHRSRES